MPGAEEIQTSVEYPTSLHCWIGNTVALEPPLAHEVTLWRVYYTKNFVRFF